MPASLDAGDSPRTNPGPEAPASGLVRWLREPLVHFLVLGLGIFAVNAALAPEVADDHLIVIDGATKTELAERFETTNGHPPTDDEMGRLVEDWIAQEMLYREGLALGMDRDDLVIRNQVIRKMAYFYQSVAEVEIPDDDTLRAYMNDNLDRYQQPERWDFVHVFIPKGDPEAKAKIDAHLSELQAGADPHRLGVRYPKGRRFRRRMRASLVDTFDTQFADAVAKMPVGTWTLAKSGHGWHAVRIDKRYAPQPAAFDRLRETVIADYQREQEQLRAREAVDELRETYRVEEREVSDAH